MRGVCESCGAATSNEGRVLCCRCNPSDRETPLPPGYIAPSRRGTCSRCGKTIQLCPTSAAEPVCQPCRREMRPQPQPRSCELCERIYTPGVRADSLPQQRFCSASCAWAWKNGARPPYIRVKRKRSYGKKAKTVARGYGARHQAERQRLLMLWQPGDPCARCGLPMWGPSSMMDLGHTADRSGWTGLEHALCNRSEAGRRGNPKRSGAVV